jgi:hypothetical protein
MTWCDLLKISMNSTVYQRKVLLVSIVKTRTRYSITRSVYVFNNQSNGTTAIASQHMAAFVMSHDSRIVPFILLILIIVVQTIIIIKIELMNHNNRISHAIALTT